MRRNLTIFSLKKIPYVSWSSSNELNFRPKFLTIFYLIFGLILVGLGETLLVTANIGVSPWFVLHQGLSFISNYSIGITTFVVSIIVLISSIIFFTNPWAVIGIFIGVGLLTLGTLLGPTSSLGMTLISAAEYLKSVILT